jgi:methyltransferase (TIGR00027 family)
MSVPGEAPIEHVSDTALWVASYRALESRRGDALFHDPLAEILAGERGRQIARRMQNEIVMAWAISLRTRIIDELIAAAIAQGVDLVLNLGAGLDARPYRMDLPASLDWVEVDYPHMVAFKEERLIAETPRCRLQRISLDLSDLAARRELFANLGRRPNPILVLTEGVTPYLSNEEVASLADDLGLQKNFRFWVLDYHSSAAAISFGRRRMKRHLRKAPFRFRPPAWESFFESHGWRLKELRYYTEEAERFNRPLQLPWRYKILRLFLTKKREQALRRMAGVAMLSRGWSGS